MEIAVLLYVVRSLVRWAYRPSIRLTLNLRGVFRVGGPPVQRRGNRIVTGFASATANAMGRPTRKVTSDDALAPRWSGINRARRTNDHDVVARLLPVLVQFRHYPVR